jgi:hypothetical protein
MNANHSATNIVANYVSSRALIQGAALCIFIYLTWRFVYFCIGCLFQKAACIIVVVCVMEYCREIERERESVCERERERDMGKFCFG